MKILIAEDERATRARIVAGLQALGHELIETSNGEEAWDQIQRHEISVVISDWLMPEMDGETLVRQIRGRQEGNYIYVIVLTSRSEKEDIVAGMNAGADDFMTKPFHADELRARIRAGLRVVRLERALAEKNRRLSEAHRELSHAHQLMKDELEAAARIQRSYLPDHLSPIPGVSFEWVYEPCDELGGDTLNIVPFSKERIGIYVIDVAGHGVSAALLSVHLSRILTRLDDSEAVLVRSNGRGLEPTPPEEVAAQLNASLQIDPSSPQFFTMVYGILDLTRQTFDYTTAGHSGPLLIRDGRATLHPPSPPGIGILPDATFDRRHLQLDEGDRLFFYSDGIFEIDDGEGDEWGEDGLARAAAEASSRTLSLSGHLEAILDAGRKWRNGVRLHDDVSLIGLELPSS